MRAEPVFVSRGRTSLVLAALVAATACERAKPVDPPPVVAFDAVVDGARTVPLEAKDVDPTTMQTNALVTAHEVIVLDEGRATVDAFRRDDGRWSHQVAQAGDNPGDVRHPRAIVALDSGNYVILDTKRSVLSFRDSTGAVRGESPLPAGYYNSLLPLRAEQRLLVTGEVLKAPKASQGRDVHELTYTGALETSYGKAFVPKSRWESVFTSLSATQVGSYVVTAMLASNELRLLDRSTGAMRSFPVAEGWWQPIDWPSDRELSRQENPQGVANRVTKWTHGHLLINGVFALTGGRLIVRFATYDQSDERVYHYAIADTTGRTFAVTQPTTARIVATAGDTLFWLTRKPSGAVDFGSGVASANVLARALDGGAAPSSGAPASAPAAVAATTPGR